MYGKLTKTDKHSIPFPFGAKINKNKNIFLNEIQHIHRNLTHTLECREKKTKTAVIHHTHSPIHSKSFRFHPNLTQFLECFTIRSESFEWVWWICLWRKRQEIPPVCFGLQFSSILNLEYKSVGPEFWIFTERKAIFVYFNSKLSELFLWICEILFFFLKSLCDANPCWPHFGCEFHRIKVLRNFILLRRF